MFCNIMFGLVRWRQKLNRVWPAIECCTAEEQRWSLKNGCLWHGCCKGLCFPQAEKKERKNQAGKSSAALYCAIAQVCTAKKVSSWQEKNTYDERTILAHSMMTKVHDDLYAPSHSSIQVCCFSLDPIKLIVKVHRTTTPQNCSGI